MNRFTGIDKHHHHLKSQAAIITDYECSVPSENGVICTHQGAIRPLTAKFCNQVDTNHGAKAAKIIQRLIDILSSRKEMPKTDAGMTPKGFSGPNGSGD